MTKKPSQLALLSNTVVAFIAFVGILVLVVFISQRHPVRLDLTESKRYSISDQSQKIVQSLEDNILIKAFYQEADLNRDQIRDLLETYRYYSKKVEYQLIDPDREPSLAKHYQIRTYGTLVLEGFGKTQSITTADEESITNAILKLAQEKQRVVYFLTGHGGRDISNSDKDGYSSAKSAIERENFQVKTLNLLVDPEVPADAALVVVANPQKVLLATELGALRQYLDRNGSIMFLLEPFADGGLVDFLKTYGILLGADIVIDTMSRVFGASYLLPVITEYGLHPITDGFNIACFFPTTRSVSRAEEAPEAADLTDLASTSDYSWADTDFRFGQSQPPEFEQGRDRQGPLTVAVIAAFTPKTSDSEKENNLRTNSENSETEHPPSQAQLAVIGDSDFASNSYFDLQGNSDFFLNTINFLAQQENLISVERPKPTSAPLTLSRFQGKLLFWIGLLLMPMVVLVTGLAVFRMRRKHR